MLTPFEQVGERPRLRRPPPLEFCHAAIKPKKKKMLERIAGIAARRHCSTLLFLSKKRRREKKETRYGQARAHGRAVRGVLSFLLRPSVLHLSPSSLG